MVDLFDFDEVDDGHRDVDVHRDVEVLHLVKAEGRDLLVVIVLVFKKFHVVRDFMEGFSNIGLPLFSGFSPTFMNRSLQLSSSDSSRQFDVWSHLVKGWTQDYFGQNQTDSHTL